jgi:hypothetical protein
MKPGRRLPSFNRSPSPPALRQASIVLGERVEDIDIHQPALSSKPFLNAWQGCEFHSAEPPSIRRPRLGRHAAPAYHASGSGVTPVPQGPSGGATRPTRASAPVPDSRSRVMRPARAGGSGGVGCAPMKVKHTERPIDPAEWQRQMNRRLRAEFIAGAEEEWREPRGRPMTAEELERVLRRYSGEVQGR